MSVSHYPFSVNTSPLVFGYRVKAIFFQTPTRLGEATEEVLLVWCVGLAVEEPDHVLPAGQTRQRWLGPRAAWGHEAPRGPTSQEMKVPGQGPGLSPDDDAASDAVDGPLRACFGNRNSLHLVCRLVTEEEPDPGRRGARLFYAGLPQPSTRRPRPRHPGGAAGRKTGSARPTRPGAGRRGNARQQKELVIQTKNPPSLPHPHPRSPRLPHPARN